MFFFRKHVFYNAASRNAKPSPCNVAAFISTERNESYVIRQSNIKQKTLCVYYFLVKREKLLRQPTSPFRFLRSEIVFSGELCFYSNMCNLVVVIHIYEYECVKYMRAQRMVKQKNATVAYAWWWKRWRDKERRISCKSHIKQIWNYFDINFECNVSVLIHLLRRLRSTILNSYESWKEISEKLEQS